MAINTALIVNLATGENNNPDQIDTMTTEISSKFNAALETASGHYHDGTDARLIYGGISGFTSETLMLANLCGWFRKGGL